MNRRHISTRAVLALLISPLWAQSGGQVVTGGPGVGTGSVGSSGLSIPRVGRWSYTASIAQPTLVTSGADNVIPGVGSAAGISANGTEGAYTKETTGAVSGNQAEFVSNAGPGNEFWIVGRNIYWSSYLRDNNADLTNQRLYFGLSNVITSFAASLAGFNSDNPVGAVSGLKYAMIRYSSVVPDTNWQCVTSNGTTQTVTNSGVIADTNFHRWEIQFTDSIPNVVFRRDGVAICTVTSTLPSATGLNAWDIMTTQTTAGKELDFAWLYTQMDF
jgi:hypothetical protein